MYNILRKKLKPFYANLIMAFWYSFLIILIILLSTHADKADFIYLHL